MTRSTHEELESDLRTLFDRQQRSIRPQPREWADPPIARLADVRPARSSRRRVAMVAAALVTSAALIAAVVVLVQDDPTRVRTSGTSPGRPNPVQWSTPQVRLDATDFSITVGGKRFLAADRRGAFTEGGGLVAEPPGGQLFVEPRRIQVRSDAGEGRYQTLELEWTEHGVPMRWFLYFESDGKDWWATEMRTYNGRRNADWVEFHGQYFRRPLGTEFTGDLDLRSNDPQSRITSRLHVTGLKLQAFRKTGATSTTTAPGS